MQCDDPNDLVSAYVDGELSVRAREAFELHLEHCHACENRLEQLRSLSRAFSKVDREPMPASLQTFLMNNLPAEPAPVQMPLLAARPPARPVRRYAFMQMAAALVAGCVLSSAATLWLTSDLFRSEQMTDDLVSAHLRSLVQESPVQIASSGQHNVKPWFAGKVDFSPTVKDLSNEGYTLVGGRLDIIAGRRVGVMVYRHASHLINVFAYPSNGAQQAELTAQSHAGYHLLTWTRDGVTYWAVSDLAFAELLPLGRNF